MKIGLEKASGKSKCRYRGCKQKPEFISEKGRIKKDTTCVWIAIDSASGGAVGYYCRDCVDQIYQEMKKILNPQLWVFQ